MLRLTVVLVPVLCLALALAGCGKKDGEYKPVEENGDVETAHGEHEPGPNEQGDVIDLGVHDFRAEIVFKEKPRRLTVYLLDHDEDQPAFADGKELTFNLKIDGQPLQVSLPAVPRQDDPQGKSSRFEATGEAVPAAIEDEHDLHGGTISVVIDGTPYQGTFEEHEHHEEDHDEAGHHAKDHD